MKKATETQPNWAPTLVKVVGPEPEPRELYFHEQAMPVSNQTDKWVKNEPQSITSTPKKKIQIQPEEDIYPLHTPKSESRSSAKLTNMFAEDLPQGDHAAHTISSDPSAVNMFSLRYTESAAATDYDLFAPNPRRPNNNNPIRGQMGRGRAPNRGRVIPRLNINRGVLGRVVVGRGQPRGGPGGQAMNLRGRAPPPNPRQLNPPNPPNLPNLNPGGPGGPGGLGGPGGPRGPGLPGPNSPQGGPPAGRGADPTIVNILERLVAAQEKQVTDKKDTKRFTQFPSEKFDGSEPGKSLDHWNLFMQFWNYVLHKNYIPGQNDAAYFATFREQFVLTLS